MLKAFILSIFLSTNLLASKEYNVDELVRMKGSLVESNAQKYLALTLKNANHWHTYWKNPGDAGLAPKFKFIHDGAEIKLQALEWPSPKRFIEQGDIWAYGYSDFYTFFFQLPKDFTGKRLTVKGSWLVCKDICIPGEDELNLTINQNSVKNTQNHFDYNKQKIDFHNTPTAMSTPAGFNIYLAQDQKGELILHYSIDKSLVEIDLKKENLVYPFPNKYFDFKHEKVFSDNQKYYLQMPVDWNGEYFDNPEDLPSTGQFEKPLKLKFLFFNPETRKRDVLTTTIDSFTTDNTGAIAQFYKNLKTTNSNPIQTDSKSLWYYLLFAFLGGVILNFMPCVLPVISLKLFSLIKHKNSSRKQLLKHNLAYTAGILFCFLLLASIIVSIKNSGEFVGWGFQLQSPVFVSIMILFLFLFSLNMFGLFEFITPGGSKLGAVKLKEGFGGDFLSGVLATILSTPCTAPFLGTALTFAFTTSNFMIFLIFLFVGLGLAVPFLFTALFPKTLVFLPRPGAWMDNFKKFLGLTLLLTIAWLYDVFLSLIGNNYFSLLLNLTLITMFFAVYFHNKMGKNKFFRLIFFLAPIAIFLSLLNHENIAAVDTPFDQEESLVQDGLEWMPWSEQKMNELKGELVFIDFTAKWCFTCKVNEKLVLQTDAFRKLVREEGIKLLLADWTKRDPIIGNWLQGNGSVGVPAYFIQKTDGTLIRLGETISIQKIKSNL